MNWTVGTCINSDSLNILLCFILVAQFTFFIKNRLKIFYVFPKLIVCMLSLNYCSLSASTPESLKLNYANLTSEQIFELSNDTKILEVSCQRLQPYLHFTWQDHELRVQWNNKALQVAFNGYIFKDSLLIKKSSSEPEYEVIPVELNYYKYQPTINSTEVKSNFRFLGMDRWAGFLNQPNWSGSAMVGGSMIWVCAILFWINSKKYTLSWLRLVFYIIGLTGCSWFVWLSYSRGAYLALFLITIVTLLRISTTFWKKGFIIIILISTFCAAPKSDTRLFSTANVNNDASISHRLIYWKAATVAMLNDYGLGVGFKQFGNYYKLYLADPEDKEANFSAVSDLFSMGAYFGVSALFLWILMATWVWLRPWFGFNTNDKCLQIAYTILQVYTVTGLFSTLSVCTTLVYGYTSVLLYVIILERKRHQNLILWSWVTGLSLILCSSIAGYGWWLKQLHPQVAQINERLWRLERPASKVATTTILYVSAKPLTDIQERRAIKEWFRPLAKLGANIYWWQYKSQKLPQAELIDFLNTLNQKKIQLFLPSKEADQWFSIAGVSLKKEIQVYTIGASQPKSWEQHTLIAQSADEGEARWRSKAITEKNGMPYFEIQGTHGLEQYSITEKKLHEFLLNSAP
jgi:hypothetical protein